MVQMDSKELPRMSTLTVILAEGLKRLGTASVQNISLILCGWNWVRIQESELRRNSRSFSEVCINLRTLDASAIGITLDETTTVEDLLDLWQIFLQCGRPPLPKSWLPPLISLIRRGVPSSHLPQLLSSPAPLARTSSYLTHPVFNRYHSGTELLRYMHRLQARTCR